MDGIKAKQAEFEDWRATLRAFCGNFDVTPGEEIGDRYGRFGTRVLGGMEMSHIATNYDTVLRDDGCIRRDDVDCLYLVQQISGRKGIWHNGQEVHLDPGDCILLDAARPMEGFYGRAGVEFATLHVPRDEMFREATDHDNIEIGVPRRAGGQRAGALNAALSHIRDYGLNADQGHGFIIELARLAFRADPRRHSLHRFGRAAERTLALKELISRHAADQGFSLADLADLSGMSQRQVQRDLQADGTSFSRQLLTARLDKVERHLRAMSQAGQRPYVTQVAYDAGFNDLSHFNRVFRREYGCTPLEFARLAVES